MTGAPCLSLHESAVRDRARIYLGIFRELSQSHGEAEAVRVLQSASRAHGLEVGAGLAQFAPRDFKGLLASYFLGPDSATYAPELREITADCVEVQFMTCPLKDGWREMGCSDAEVCTLLRCATAFDAALWEAAGFDYELEPWAPGRAGCCRTRVTEKRRS
ncbi:L-2-amino-thiazoline-4-carboxylic acid hydrolase [uncultured Roseobacter sp.]|uniref:L-2-amino-thiazoline-4-carboxylic acid hydrolase n=1 Tax=uncultured Roseobacter sp. TaxID=114847 RepID=UPI00262F6A7B|nr:L-2-amino-thiazoline-4-carboxylic acid hydrolase [uncultured Roseobacter sp.]